MQLLTLLVPFCFIVLASADCHENCCRKDCMKELKECLAGCGSNKACRQACKKTYKTYKDCKKDCTGANQCPSWGSCPVPSETTTCIVTISNGDVACNGANPMTLMRVNSEGPVYTLHMANWKAVKIHMNIVNAKKWSLNIGNSPTNNGAAGDGYTTMNDSEMDLYDNELRVWASDYGSKASVLSQKSATNLSGDAVTAIVCDGYFSWESSTAKVSATHQYIFQIDGDEPDGELPGGINDSDLYLAINQVISASSSSRKGSGVQSVAVVFAK